LSQNRRQWQTVVTAVLNPPFHEAQCILGLAEQFLAAAGFWRRYITFLIILCWGFPYSCLNYFKHRSTTCWAKGRSASCGKRVKETQLWHSSIGVFLIGLPENRSRSYPRNVCLFNFILNAYDGPSSNYFLFKKGSVPWSSSCVGVLFTCFSLTCFRLCMLT
jgi:hypothetical protein